MDNDISPIPAPETNYNSGGAMDWQRDRYNEMVQAGRPGLDPISGSGGFRGSGGGSGFAGLAGWAFPAGMIGAVVGGILGRGPLGAVIGAAVFAGAIWVPMMVLHGIRGNAATRPILPWMIKGGIAGVVFGAILFIDETQKMTTGMANVGIFGAMSGAAIQLVRRGLAR